MGGDEGSRKRGSGKHRQQQSDPDTEQSQFLDETTSGQIIAEWRKSNIPWFYRSSRSGTTPLPLPGEFGNMTFTKDSDFRQNPPSGLINDEFLLGQHASRQNTTSSELLVPMFEDPTDLLAHINEIGGECYHIQERDPKSSARILGTDGTFQKTETYTKHDGTQASREYQVRVVRTDIHRKRKDGTEELSGKRQLVSWNIDDETRSSKSGKKHRPTDGWCADSRERLEKTERGVRTCTFVDETLGAGNQYRGRGANWSNRSRWRGIPVRVDESTGTA